MVRLRFISLAVLVTALALALSNGCARRQSPELEPGIAPSATLLAPGTSDAALDRAPSYFYPLAPGNRWTYRDEYYAELRPLGDTAAFRGRTGSTIERSIACPATYDGRDWWIEQSVYHPDGQIVPLLSWIPLRQDRSALEELEIIPTPPDPCGGASAISAADLAARLARTIANGVTAKRPGGPARALLATNELVPAFERALAKRLREVALLANPSASIPSIDVGATTLTRLRYPLHIGASWAIRPETDVHGNPTFLATVEEHESLDLAGRQRPAWRIRVTSPFFGPDDEIETWYGRDGFLRLEARGSLVVLDEAGHTIGTGSYIERQWMTGLDSMSP